jgi:hypothetical protein
MQATTTTLEAAAERSREPYFLVDIIEVKLESMQDFVLTMGKLLAEDFPQFGWELISATYYLTGRPDIVMHIWQIPTAESLRDTMVTLGENSTYLELQKYIASEQQHLLSRMLYDPRASASARTPGDRATKALMTAPRKPVRVRRAVRREAPEVTSARRTT